MRALLAIRHAESTMNAVGLWQGQADPPLSARGRQQAGELALALAGPGDWTILSSDLARARETAEILASVLGSEPVLEPGLREMDVGVWSARPHREIQERWPEDYARVRAGDWQVRPGGGETRDEVRRRALVVLERATAGGAAGRRLALVTHQGVLRALVPGIQLANAGCVQLSERDWRRADERAADVSDERAADVSDERADDVADERADELAEGGPL